MGWRCLDKWLDASRMDEESTVFTACFEKLRHQYKHKSGHIFLASMLWSIWIARNELVFKDIRISVKGT